MPIQEVRCPRCAIRRTLYLGEWGCLCCNCRLRWGQLVAAPGMRARRHVPEPPLYRFKPADLVRLERYRAAVRAGVYSDGSWPAPVTITTSLAAERQAEGP